MLFYDFEVFKYDWLVVLIDMNAQQETVIVNNSDELETFWKEHRSDIWVGFNSRRYDIFILQSILCGFNPKECNDFIIIKGRSGYEFSPLLKDYPIYNYDVMSNIDRGLKWFEGSMGNSVIESSIPFDIDRKLTEAEIVETIKYCRHDVEQTIEIFIERYADFEAQMELLKMYKMPLAYINKTKVQLSAEILGAVKQQWTDEFDIHIPECAKVQKYKDIPKWFMNPENHKYKDGNKSVQLKKQMAGIEVVFAWGGVHGAKPKYHSKGYFLNMDVGSLYPTLDCLYPEYCFSRSVPDWGIERYKEIRKFRLQLKAEGKKKEQAPFKIVLNGTYGAMKDKYNKLFDPRGANNTCVFGQILVGVDLFEKLENISEIIQVNTDGILIRKPDEIYNVDSWFQQVDDIAYEWETRTGLSLEFDDYGWGEIFQKDVNNYLIIDGYDGHFKSKGAYVKKLSRLDFDLPIVNKALVDYMTKGIPLQTTITECNDLIMFQQVKKISSKYKLILHGDKAVKEKCVRVFASNKESDAGLFKIHAKTEKKSKMEGTPEHCFIFNDDVNKKKCPEHLDKNWYLRIAQERLKGFGV